MTKNSRLREVRLKKGYSQKKVGQLLGINPETENYYTSQYITSLEKKVDFKRDIAERLAVILDTTADWLLSGDYSISKTSNMNITNKTHNKESHIVPYYNLTHMALIKRGLSDIKEEPEFYVDAAPMNDCTAYIPIRGKSMLPDLSSDMIVGIVRITDYSLIQWGEAHLVIADTGLGSIKTVKNVYQMPDDQPESF